MEKRGQVTLFIIIGIVIVILIALGVYFRGELFDAVGLTEELSYPSEIQEVVDEVQDCVDISTYEAVVSVGYKGGYYNTPSSAFINEYVTLPYYNYNGTNYIISLEEMESELSEYVEFLVGSCVELDDYEYEFDYGAVDATTVVNNNSVEFEVDYPIDVTVGENVYNIEDSYEVVVEANLGWLYDVAANLVDYSIRYPDEINYDYMLEQGVASIKFVPYEEGAIVYILKDTTSFNGEENYTFMYAEYYPELGYLGECIEDYECEDGFVCVDEVCLEEEVEEEE